MATRKKDPYPEMTAMRKQFAKIAADVLRKQKSANKKEITSFKKDLKKIFKSV